MLACLVIPAALVLAVALYTVSPAEPPQAAGSQSPAGPYDDFRFTHVGAGVKRLIDDRAGHRPGDYDILFGATPDVIAIEPDGSVLLCCDRPDPLLDADDETTLHRLGDPEPVASWVDRRMGLDEAHDLALATDGTIWLAGNRVAALVDGTWQRTSPRGEGALVAAGHDGAMWADISDGELRIARYRGGAEAGSSPRTTCPGRAHVGRARDRDRDHPERAHLDRRRRQGCAATGRAASFRRQELARRDPPGSGDRGQRGGCGHGAGWHALGLSQPQPAKGARALASGHVPRTA